MQILRQSMYHQIFKSTHFIRWNFVTGPENTDIGEIARLFKLASYFAGYFVILEFLVIVIRRELGIKVCDLELRHV